jgi:hypothetical protein
MLFSNLFSGETLANDFGIAIDEQIGSSRIVSSCLYVSNTNFNIEEEKKS